MKRMKYSKEKMSIESRDGIIYFWIIVVLSACYFGLIYYLTEGDREGQKEKNKETSSVNTKVVNKKENVLTYKYYKKLMSNNINIR